MNKSNLTRGIFDLPKGKIICAGDLHGDMETLLSILQDSKLIKKKKTDSSNCFTNDDYNCEKWNWTGGNKVFIQLGDIFDGRSRGISDPSFEDHELEIYQFLVDLKIKAKEYNGDVLLLLGNHELMNIEHDFRYVSDMSKIKCFNESKFGKISFKSSSKETCNHRTKLFDKNGNLRKSMAENMYGIIKVGPFLFCHAGLENSLAKKYKFNIPYMNNILRCYLKNKIQNNEKLMNVFDNIYKDSSGILWFRGLAKEESNYCNSNKNTFEKLSCSKMIVGHTPQSDGISGKCNNSEIIAIDVGLSGAFGKSPYAEYLVISPDKYNNREEDTFDRKKAPISKRCYNI
tara:strand:+ start:653 stop:1684 length:1032 start_codon:yes stop_codon:yes gene_type:complete